MQPTGDGIALANGDSATSEQQKSGLKDIFGVRLAAQNATGDAQHHWPMPAEQNLKRPMVVGVNELPQKMCVRLGSSLIRNLTEEVSQGLNTALGHIG